MQDLQTIRAWLMSWPQWESGEQLFIAYTDAVPGSSGLFPGGLEEVSRKADVLGNVSVRCRYRFTLYRVMDHQTDGTQDAIWLQQLQMWVQEQSLKGLAPAFGDIPGEEFIRAERGRLTKIRQPGNTMYAVDFTAEFTKQYEVI